MKPAVLFADLAGWAVNYLHAALGERPEPYTAGVLVRSVRPGEDLPAGGRWVTVRDDGGPDDTLTKVASLGINVGADDKADAADLALMVAALLRAAPGHGPVVEHVGTSGPYPIAGTRPHRYLSVDLRVDGVPL